MRHAVPIVFAGLLTLAAVPARGDEPARPDASEQAVTLSPVALPIVVDGRLANYVFVTVKVWLTPNADLFALRDKEPYFRDALVRAAHRTPFVIKGDYNHLDLDKLKASLLREASAIAGPGAIQSVQVLNQTPKKWLSTGR